LSHCASQVAGAGAVAGLHQIDFFSESFLQPTGIVAQAGEGGQEAVAVAFVAVAGHGDKCSVEDPA
jgi:hypothetical protein